MRSYKRTSVVVLQSLWSELVCGTLAHLVDENQVAHTGSGGKSACSCSACGASARAGSKFCSKCGSGLVAPSARSYTFDQSDANDAIQDIEQCPGCGADVGAQSTFCISCGLTLDFVEDENGKLVPHALADEEFQETDFESDETDLEWDEAAPEFPTAAEPEGFCLGCGSALDQSANSCHACGLSYEGSGEDWSILNDGDPLGRSAVPLCPVCAIPIDLETFLCPLCGRAYSPDNRTSGDC